MTSEKDNRFKVSWSSLQRFELCRQKDYLYRIRTETPFQDSRNFLAGTVTDRIMRDWLDAPDVTMHSMVDEYFDRSVAEAEESGTIRWRDKNDRKKVKTVCEDAANQLEPILRARVLPYDYEPAKRFYTPVKIRKPDGEVQEIILRGEFDLLIRDPAENRLQVWDLKTTANNDYWKKTLGQLVFYDLAVIAMFGEPPIRTGLIQPLCDEQVKEFTFDNTHRAEMWGRITAMLQAEWTDDHSPKADSVGCNYCAVSHACVKFKSPLTLTRKNA
jgi:hypothetical protein